MQVELGSLLFIVLVLACIIFTAGRPNNREEKYRPLDEVVKELKEKRQQDDQPKKMLNDSHRYVGGNSKLVNGLYE